MTTSSTASSMSWKVAMPVVAIAALCFGGLASHHLEPYQVVTLGPLLYSLWVFSAGAFAYRADAPALEAAVPEDEWPMVSIMIPAHNEELVIANTVESLLKLDYPRYEIIVIDDHSSDQTGAILRRYPIQVVTRRNLPNRGKSEALNAGLEVAQGDIICVFDADSEVAPSFLRRAVTKLIDNPEICGVQCQVRMYNRKQNFLTASQDDEFAFFNELQQMGRHSLGLASALGGNGQLTRRSAIRAVGGWSPKSLTEDLDLTIRLFLAGRGRIAHCSEAIVWQEGVGDLKALVRQRTRWAEGMLRCFGEYAGAVLFSKEMPLALRFDALYALMSVFLPLLTLTGLLYTGLAFMPGVFKSSLPFVSVFASIGSLVSLFAWAAIISYKRDRRVDLLPPLRGMIYLLHWVPALFSALKNVFTNEPVVWAKTEHRGHGLVTAKAAVAPTPSLTAVGAGEPSQVA